MLNNSRYRTFYNDEADSISHGLHQNPRVFLDICNSHSDGLGVYVPCCGRDNWPNDGNASRKTSQKHRIDIIQL